MLKIDVITTGGTIEKVYSEQTSSVEKLDNKIDRYLRRLRLPDCEVRVAPLTNNDSLEMTDADRRRENFGTGSVSKDLDELRVERQL